LCRAGVRTRASRFGWREWWGKQSPPTGLQYDGDFNPIEMAISKLKGALRKLAERTVAGLIAILEGCADLFKPDERQNYFEAPGYDLLEVITLHTT
jgi:hypothetical protein